MKQKRVIACMLALFIFVTVSGCGQKASEEDSSEGETLQGVAVEIADVQTGEMAAESSVAGTVEATNSVQVFPMLAGTVLSLNVAEGDMVTKGQTLFQVDTSTVTSTYSSLKQSYSATKASTDQSIATAQIGVRNAQLAVENAQRGVEDAQRAVENAQLGVDNAQITVDQATTAYENTKALHDAGAASDQALTQAEQGLQQANVAMKNAQSTVKQAENGLQQAQAGVTQAQSGVATAQAAVQQAVAGQRASLAQIQASMAQIEAQAKLGTVTAPVSGLVTSVGIERGGMAAQSAPAVVIAEGGNIDVTVNVSETVLSELNIGDRAELTIQSVSADPFDGSIATIATAANPQTRLYEVTIALPQAMKPTIGAFANVTLFTNRRSNAVYVPTEAILTDGDEEYVYILTDDRPSKDRHDEAIGNGDGPWAKKVLIRTGLVGDGITEVTERLIGGERLVVKGQSYLSDGTLVRIVNGEDA